MNGDRGGAHRVDGGHDDQIVAEPGRSEVADGDIGDGVNAGPGFERPALVDADGAIAGTSLKTDGRVDREKVAALARVWKAP